jgi:hypothetical protein
LKKLMEQQQQQQMKELEIMFEKWVTIWRQLLQHGLVHWEGVLWGNFAPRGAGQIYFMGIS